MIDKPKASIKLLFLSLCSIMLSLLAAEAAGEGNTLEIINTTKFPIYFKLTLNRVPSHVAACATAGSTPKPIEGILNPNQPFNDNWRCFIPYTIEIKLTSDEKYGEPKSLIKTDKYPLLLSDKDKEKRSIQMEIKREIVGYGSFHTKIILSKPSVTTTQP